MKNFNCQLSGRNAEQAEMKHRPVTGRPLGALKKAVLLCCIPLCFSECKKAEALVDDAALSASKSTAGTSAADFTIAVIPDTQYYTSSQNGGLPAMFTDQIDWIKANQVTENIVYVASLGDITDHGNDYASEWTNGANNGYYGLESQPGFTDGIPYGTCVGNHDQTPNTGHPLTCSTSSYNGKFGANRFRPRAYYGESYYGSASNNNDSHYDLFTAGGMDFIVIYTEYDSHGDDNGNMADWVYNTLVTYASRKAIIVSHMLTDASGGWGTTGSSYEQGHVLYDRIKSRQNVMMMLGGHFTGESYREDVYKGTTVRTYMSDYQGWANGGSGYMRLMKFSPDNNTVSVKTYSPYANVWQTDANSQFTKPLLPSPPQQFANGKYKFINRLTGKAIIVSTAVPVNGDRVFQWTYSPAVPNDEWNLAKLGNGFYRITNANSAKDMVISGASTADGAKAVQWTYSSDATYNDEWWFAPITGGYYKIVNRNSGNVLTVDGASSADGTDIEQVSYTAVSQNQWSIIAIP